jgi:aspartate racemase
MKEPIVIGILGGMGTYATIDLFKKYALTFQAEKEWDRPRIIIDNNCTMPSRVRAILYNENVDLLVDEMANSLNNLVKSGANRIILACNTSHLFLPKIINQMPQIEDVIVNIVDATVKEILENNIKEVYLLASEGTIESRVYDKKLQKCGLICTYPNKDDYKKLRVCIEAVKQNKYSEYIKETFFELVNRGDNILLGCTELPVLLDKYKSEIPNKPFFDPVQIALDSIKKEYVRNI